MLTDADRERIRLEEVYRNEVKRTFETEKPRAGRLWSALNSSFGLWLLSAVFISGAGSLYTQHRARLEEDRARTIAIERLDLEIASRYSQALGRLDALKKRNRKQAGLWDARASLDVQDILKQWKGEPSVEIAGLYPEYTRLSLPALMAELRRQLLQGEERDAVDRTLAEVMGGGVVGRSFPELGDPDSAGKVLIELLLPRWKGNWFFYTDCSTANPFC